MLRNVVVTLALLGGFCTAHAGPREEALAVAQEWTKAFTASDVDAIVKLHAPDALFFGTNSKTLVTKPAEIRAYFESALNTNKPRTAALGEHSVHVMSDTSAVIVGLDTLTAVKDGKPLITHGRDTFVLEKRDGKWLIVHFHRSFVPG